MKRLLGCFAFLSFVFLSCSQNSSFVEVTSPDGNIKVKFSITNQKAYYSILYLDKEILKESRLGFALKNQPSLIDNFILTNSSTKQVDETWEQVWGAKKNVRNHYNEIVVNLAQNNELKRKLNITFRVYDDGMGFRYEIPEQENIDSVVIMDEITEFHFTNNHSAWWIPAYKDNRYEYLYQKLLILHLHNHIPGW